MNLYILGAGGAAVSLAVGISGYYFYSLKSFRQKHELCSKDGDETSSVMFDEDTTDLIDKVIWRLNLPPVQEKALSTFVCAGHKPVHKGSLRIRLGAVVGFPKSLMYTSLEEVKQLPIDANLQHSLSPELLESLKKTLLLTEREKAFLVARELSLALNYDPIVSISLQCLFLVSAYMFAVVATNAVPLLKRQKNGPLRLGAYGLICASQWYMYNFTIRSYRNNATLTADREAASLTPFYAVGALDYYTKLLERHKLLRQIMGNNGKELYTAKGDLANENPPITERKDRIAGLVASWEMGELKVLPQFERSQEIRLNLGLQKMVWNKYLKQYFGGKDPFEDDKGHEGS